MKFTCLAVVAWAALILSAARPAAQFETPNRAFHNGTPFRLDGRHQTVPCAACHVAGQFAGTPKACVDCHWVRRRDDPFQTRLGSQCDSCHRTTAWGAVQWDHGSMTGAPLNAAHRSLSCVTCHVAADVRTPPQACVTCHRQDYDATKEPAHAAAGFPVTCSDCHRTGDSDWHSGPVAGLNHAAIFPLVGRHAAATCSTCHRNGVYKGTARDCAGCHMPQYSSTRNPNHAAAGFPTTCETCHRATDLQWGGGGGGFNHGSVFALVGRHATATCGACHKNNVFRGTPRDCVGCHLQQYNSTTAPNHVAARFPTTCETCHNAAAPQWTGASFNHAAVFPLVGRHAAASCATCHVNNVYKGTPQQCSGCHMPQYASTRNPNHAAAGFPTTCDSCHRAADSSWNQGRFTHTWFPLSGPHNVQCTQCHTAPSNYAVFSCTVCHQRATTDEKHRQVGGYAYDSARCYACHPNGKH